MTNDTEVTKESVVSYLKSKNMGDELIEFWLSVPMKVYGDLSANEFVESGKGTWLDVLGVERAGF